MSVPQHPAELWISKAIVSTLDPGRKTATIRSPTDAFTATLAFPPHLPRGPEAAGKAFSGDERGGS